MEDGEINKGRKWNKQGKQTLIESAARDAEEAEREIE